MTAVANPREDRLARPFHPTRLRLYLVASVLVSVVFGVTTAGVTFGWLEPTLRLDVIANLLLALPILGLPLIALWDAPGEKRTRAEKGAELILVFLPLSASSQLSYEFAFVLGHPFGVWDPAATDPGWTWLWWQYAQADGRYNSENPYAFAMEVTAVLAGLLMAIAWSRLIRPDTSPAQRVKHLWLAFAGCSAIVATTITFIVSAARVGFDDIGQGAVYGLWFKFLIMNGAFVIIPIVVLIAIAQQIGHLERSLGAAAARNDQEKGSLV
jgi:hypothetical protein